MPIQQFSKLEFCEDFGDGPLLLAHITTDRSIIAVVSALGGFVAMAALGFPGAVFVAFAALNDFSYAGKVEADRIGGDDEPIAITDGDSTAIDVTAETVINAVDEPIAVGPIPTDSQPTDHSADAGNMAVAPSMVHSKVLCPIVVLGREPYQSTALIGGQRSGKTYIVALHTQNVKRSHKSKIIYVNLYDALGDAANDWDHADICLTFHIKKMGVSQAKAAIEKVTAAVEQFNNDTNAIFIFDEWVAFTSKSNAWTKKASQENTAALVESKATQCYIAPEGIGTSAVDLMNEVMSVSGELGSIGKKQLKAIWLLSPMVKASALEPQGLCMKDLAPMVVAIPPDRSIIWEHPTTGIVQEITFDDAGYRASMANLGLMPIEKVPHMEVDRMMCLKNTWYSLDNLPKLEKVSKQETRSSSPPIASPAPIASQSSEERKAEIARMKANIERLEALNQASHDKNVHYDIECELTDDFDPPRDRLERLWEASPAETDPAIELINEEQNSSKREALTIAYQWAMARKDKGDSIDRQTFLERARKDRNCEYLRDNRDEIWHCLEALIN